MVARPLYPEGPVKQPESQKPGKDAFEVLSEARTGLFRATLLFGSIAVALALILAPAADRHAKTATIAHGFDLDPIQTGSIHQSDPSRYIVRRSVLQESGAQPCLMFPDGSQRGAC